MNLCSFKHMAILGNPLAEVFSVIIDHDADESKLYGTITVDDGYGTLNIYNVEPEDATTICSGHSLLLSNRDRAILATCHFTVHFDLKDKMNGDAEFVRGSFSWDANADGLYDKLLVKNVKGKLGLATIYYTVHMIAIEANVAVEFIEGEIEVQTVNSSLDIYGRLVARYRDWYGNDASQNMKDHCQVMIFEGSLGKLEKGDRFILDRSVVSLPPYTSLVIRIYLQCTEDEVLFDDEVEFSAISITHQSARQDIKVTSGVLRVSVAAIDYAQSSFLKVQDLRKSLRECDWLPQL